MTYFKHDKALVSEKAEIGEETRIWAFSNILDGAKIGHHCNICDGCFVEQGTSIGNHVTIKNNVAIFEGVMVDDDVFIGANTTFINDRSPRSNNDGCFVLEKTIIKKSATIGAGSTIMCGVEIGEYSFIGAGSLVTKNIEPYALYYGHPAILKGYVCQCSRQLREDLKCQCGKTYKKTDSGIEINE